MREQLRGTAFPTGKFNQRKERGFSATGCALPTYTLPSGAQTYCVPPIPTYAGYSTDATPNRLLNGDSNTESMSRGQPWWVQKRQHEFLESERGRLGSSIGQKDVAEDAAKEVGMEVDEDV